MAYHDDLIQHAIFLSELNLPDEPKQVDLRRAVSAAYYGLFHLLTAEAAQNWKHQGHRDRFARMFDHGRMKTCSSPSVVWDGHYAGHSTFLITATLKTPAQGALSDLLDRVYNRVVSKEMEIFV